MLMDSASFLFTLAAQWAMTIQLSKLIWLIHLYRIHQVFCNTNCLEMLSQSVLSRICCPLRITGFQLSLGTCLIGCHAWVRFVHQCLSQSWLAFLVHLLWSVYTSAPDHRADQGCPSPWPKSLGEVWSGHFCPSPLFWARDNHTCAGPGVPLVRAIVLAAPLWV